ncbi:MAG TPA: N-acetylmuramoyl-L-alanine amidase [Gaiellaceae bacterium]|nr:N-acetylmuramoyl-L-alanine amidase [Gaiellaceae bacterium]
MQKFAVTLATLVALAVPSLARAGDVAMRVQEVPLGPRTLAAAPSPMHFNMLALHWIGGGTVSYRVRRLHGGWSAWVTADADVAPDGGTGRWHDGNLDWTGAADGVQFRPHGAVQRLRAYELWSRVTTKPARRLTATGTPAIVSRAGWGADEEIVRAKPSFAAADRLAVVHHTAGTNTYTAAQAAAIVRGIEVYHVRGNGWNDIGYNFLVDRFGTVYEGRGGGTEQNVIGAHSEGFNTGTVGVALIGNYARATPPKVQQAALVTLLAWRLDVAHVDPLSTVVYTSGGNLKFRAGKVVTLRAVAGHRDTGPSECPGNGTYVLLPGLAKRVSLTGLPKLYTPTVSGALGGPVRIQARLSSALPWTVTVVDQLRRPVASGSGNGTAVDWTWSSLVAGKGLFTWTISSPGARPASGTIGIGRPVPAPTLSLTNLATTPSVITPSADGSADAMSVGFTLGAAALVTAQVLDQGGVPLLTVISEQRAAGSNSFEWGAHVLPDGRYRIAVTAKTGTKSVTKTADMAVDRTLTGLQATPIAISPNGDGINDGTTLTFSLTQSVPVRFDITQAGVVVGSPFQGELGIGPQTIAWNGTGFGAPLFDGTYQATITVTDQLGDVQLAVPITIDNTPPKLTLADKATLKFTLDEPATVTLLVNQTTRIVLAEPKGTFRVPYQGPAVYQLSGTAQDLAGNTSPVIAG